MSEEDSGYLVGNDDMSIAFADEENMAIASIKPDVLRPVLSEEQFTALTKLISCISACVFMNQGGQKQ